MPSGPLDPGMFAPCGMDCTVCYRHCAHKAPCAGCLKSDEGKPEHCRACGIKDCAREKGLAYCHECPAWPCARIKRLDKSYRTRYGASLVEKAGGRGRRGWRRLWPTKSRPMPAPPAEASCPCTTANAASAAEKRNEPVLKQ